MRHTILIGDVLTCLKSLPECSVQCVVTSPPYWGLRDYGMPGQIGLEPTPEEYVEKMVDVFHEVRRVLRDDGVLWLNLGDSFADKNLVGIPWRVAFALQADGWYLRSDIIWCLSGGAWVYARTQKGDMPMMVRDMARLKPETVQLWNGQKWTSLLGMSKSSRQGNELEIVLRSGERIACTPTHRFPTNRGLLEAKDIRPGDVLQRCNLPEPEGIKDCAIDEDAAWFAGLYVAEGSRSGNTIQIAGHAKEERRWERVQAVAAKYGGTATRTVDGNSMDIRVYGKVLNAIVDELTTGRTAKTKGFAPVVWRYSNRFISEMVDGYLSGDGHLDGDRWRLGFTRNYNLERDLRTACARLGWQLTLNLSSVEYDGRQVPTFRGEIRKRASNHGNAKDRAEVVEIRKARCREVYDLGVADEPHLFALASGILTHNSKPNPMPESVTDRPTKSHEYVFLLTKRARYFYDADAVREAQNWAGGAGNRNYRAGSENGREAEGQGNKPNPAGRNRRTVWEIATQPTPEVHFATFPEALVEPCIKAGTSERGCCPKCGGPVVRVTTSQSSGSGDHRAVPGQNKPFTIPRGDYLRSTTGWEPSCTCDVAETVPCVVLDPFGGSGTVAKVARDLGRSSVLIELNPEYVGIAKKRLRIGEQLDSGVCEYVVEEVGS